MANHSSFDQFLLLEEAAQQLSLQPADLRRAIACGIVPVRRDNKGRIRIHRNEVPDNLLQRLATAEAVPELQIEVHADEIYTLTEKLSASESYRARLEHLLEQQSQALDRSAHLLDAQSEAHSKATGEAHSASITADSSSTSNSPDTGVLDQALGVHKQAEAESTEKLNEANERLQKQQAEIGKLSDLLSRAFNAIEQREQQIASETGQLAGTADKAMELLDRAISDGEKSTSEASRLSSMMGQALDSSGRLEREIDQRNNVIDNQHNLMERLVKLSERTVDAAPQTPAPKRKLSFWQRFWRGRKGI